MQGLWQQQLKIFLRTALYLPVAFVLYVLINAYVMGKFAQTLEHCMQQPLNIHNPEQVRGFVQCLQKRSNSWVQWRTKPERYYQATTPHTPCQWVGRWQAKRDDMSFAIELKPDGRYVIDSNSLKSKTETEIEIASFKGVWSSPEPQTILWFNNQRIWPIDQNTVKWLNENQLVITEQNGTETYYQRQSYMIPNCPANP
ncbi:hypothetical protein [Agitococcus lubricus]|uniref:Uncharacterized protein n=1 Tax=Agitococcus lubricus TaxID=1077255 RepID=A0A2T5J1I0_9GAMM|nr:hypothetical protein [Agitococcus lubricus]PTQ90299.1 hypothetical protein C8N29_10352 [Agitococcus lubricus]